MRTHVVQTVLLALTTTGCAASNIAYHPSSLAAPAVRTARVFIDRDGEFYPAAGIDTDRFRQVGYLLHPYFQEAQREHTIEWTSMLRMYGVAEGEFDSVWQTLQDSIAARTAREAGELARSGALVVLIHGYNNTAKEAREAYDSVHRNLFRRRDRYGEPSYLEIYWDGLTDRGESLRNPAAWGSGQHNAYLVGLALRRILNALPHQTPIRILTHSHGGKIASVALWKVTSSIDPRASAAWRVRYDAKNDDRVRHSIPTHPDIRLAMLAPAMPGNVLGDYAKPGGGPPTPVSRVIVGRNSRDYAVSKNIFNTVITRFLGINSATHGSTTLGARPGEFEKYAPVFNHTGEPKIAFCVDFSKTRLRPREHAWTTYMQREEIDSVLDLLFLNQVTEANRCHHSQR